MTRLALTPHSALDPRAARAWRWRLVLRNLLAPSPRAQTQPRHALQGSGEQWYDVAIADVIAVQEAHRPECVVLRRRRGHFVRLLLRGLWLALRLLGGHRRAVRKWRTEAPILMTEKFWNDYLRKTEPRPLESGTAHRSLTVAAQT